CRQGKCSLNLFHVLPLDFLTNLEKARCDGFHIGAWLGDGLSRDRRRHMVLVGYQLVRAGLIDAVLPPRRTKLQGERGILDHFRLRSVRDGPGGCGFQHDCYRWAGRHHPDSGSALPTAPDCNRSLSPYEGGFIRAVLSKDRSIALTHEQLQAIVVGLP